MNSILKVNTLLKSLNRFNSLKSVYLSSIMSETKYNFDSDSLKARKSDHPIHNMLLSRTSPREMTGEDISDPDLMSLFEAARWAPSHYNLQPWRFIYVKRNENEWKKFMDLLWPLNQ